MEKINSLNAFLDFFPLGQLVLLFYGDIPQITYLLCTIYFPPTLSRTYSIQVLASPFHQNISLKATDDLHITKVNDQFLGFILLDFQFINLGSWNIL